MREIAMDFAPANGKLAVQQNAVDYLTFIGRKMQLRQMSGFEPIFMPNYLKDFQRYCVDWALRNARVALFEDCGLGKSVQELVFAENVVRYENKPVLLMCPLAVGEQMKREAEKFDIEAQISRDGKFHGNAKIVITNYERLHYFNPNDFVGSIADESSAIKAFDGKRRKQVTRFMSKHKYRLMGTATAAPNDYIELGTHSEALGELTQSEMIDQYFRSSDKKRHDLFKEGDFWNRAKYFFKAHAEIPFWRWVSSWARALRLPSDLGFDDNGFILPNLEEEQITLDYEYIPDGELFPRIARTFAEQRAERKRTLGMRCEKVAEIVAQNPDENIVVWCHYNPEGELLEKLIPGAVEVAGRHSDDEKEERLNAFSRGETKVLITKQKIAGWGLNWQHVGLQIMFPSHSFELRYQSIRRSWRFGRKDPVRIITVTTPGEAGVTNNLKKKETNASKMFSALVREMNHSQRFEVRDGHNNPMEVPAWL